MSNRYEPRGLLSLPPVPGQQIRYSTLAKQYHTAPAPNIPSAPLMPSNHPAPWVASSDWIPIGLMNLQGHAATRVFRSSNPYAGLEFPAEKYSQVKRDVDYMREHPYEETLRYKVECLLESSGLFIQRMKSKARSRGRVVMFRIRRCFNKQY